VARITKADYSHAEAEAKRIVIGGQSELAAETAPESPIRQASANMLFASFAKDPMHLDLALMAGGAWQH
jgi:hypothetical protein